MTSDVLIVENRGHVRVLTMNRPDKHNALDTPLTTALLHALHDADADDYCRAVVLAGAGRSFCAGADTGEFAGFTGDGATAAAARADLTTTLHRSFSQIKKPIVSAVHGNALGGGAGLALACDLMVAADDMRLGYPELKHGIVAAVVMSNLVRQMGPKAAFALVATGRIVDGAGALALQIAFESVPVAQVLERAVSVAAGMAAWSPRAMAVTKQLFYRVSELTLSQGLDAGRDTNLMMRSFPRAQGGAA